MNAADSGRWPVIGAGGQLPMPWLASGLQRGLGMQAHAVLVHAAPGCGSLALQLALAQSWLCESPGPEKLACGECSSCHLVRQGTHPDLRMLWPQQLAQEVGFDGGQPDDGEASSKRKPSRQIRIDDVRDALAWMATTASRGRAKVVLVHPAEALNPVSANALLKTLEEPPAGARLVLAAADPAALLPTIRSRCQVLALPLPPHASARAWLVQAGMPDRDATVLLKASGGQPLQAQAMAAAGVDAAAWEALPRQLAAGEAGMLAGWGRAQALAALAKLCHDTLRVVHGASPWFFEPSTLSSHAAPPRVLAWSRELQEAATRAEHPLNEPLQFEQLVLRARHALAKPARTRAG